MDKIKTGSLISNAVLIIIVLILLRFVGCGHGKTQPCAEVGRKTDTITRYIDRTDTLYKTIAVYVPKPVRVDSLGTTGHRPQTMDNAQQTSPTVLPISYYADSLYRAREFKAVICDTVLGRILGRSVQWADLSPITERIVTNTITVEKKQPLVKVYLGASAGVQYATPLTRGGIDIAPTGSLILSDRYMVDVGYYILGGEITAGLKVKLSFRK